MRRNARFIPGFPFLHKDREFADEAKDVMTIAMIFVTGYVNRVTVVMRYKPVDLGARQQQGFCFFCLLILQFMVFLVLRL